MPERGLVAVFSGGGTGGHLYPALALAEALVSLRPEVRPVFVGAARGVESRVLPARGVEHLLLPVRGVARGRVWENLGILPVLFTSLVAVWRLFRRVRPALVVVTGGYAGGPAGLVARLRGIPLAVQEQNAVPGMTTRLLARWAQQVHLAFPEAAELLPARARDRVRVGGNPVRPPERRDPGEAARAFGLAPGDATVLVVGGSQGSAALNRTVGEVVRRVAGGELSRPEGLQFLWATGPSHLEGVRLLLGEMGDPVWVRAVGYLDDMAAGLAVARLAVSRAGAMATSEFLAWGVPAVLIPLPSAAADHQTRNALALENAGAAMALPEGLLTPEALWNAVTALVSDPSRLASMAAAARARGRPEAAMEIARELGTLLPPLVAT